MNKIKKSYVIVAAILTIIVVYIACFKTKTTNLHTITQIQTTSIDSKSKKLTTYDVLSNGKIKLTSKFSTINHSERVEVDPTAFDTYVKNRTTHLKIIKIPSFKNQKKQKVADANYKKMLYSIAKNVHSDIYKLTLFKTDKSYYAFFQVNQWILDVGTLYKYTPSSNRLIKICDLENKNVVSISK